MFEARVVSFVLRDWCDGAVLGLLCWCGDVGIGTVVGFSGDGKGGVVGLIGIFHALGVFACLRV
jgi:hypothetical protein